MASAAEKIRYTPEQYPDGLPVLIGPLPMLHLDLVVDMKSHSLIGNPAHGGEHVYEMY